ncbi:hypothetical protein DFH06DRAFT_1316660 [Mycena polygramma]|nr:hypothetical protein DFH06DRAFT_1316660 [Mycena polygramma]
MDLLPTLSFYLESPAHEKFYDSRLFDDYVPIKDISNDPTASVFIYKSTVFANSPTPGHWGRLEWHEPMMFGEMDELEGRNPAKLRIKCPSSLKCSIKAKYAKQVKALQEPIEHDKAELGGVVDNTWFGNATGPMKDEGHIYVHVRTGIQYEYDYRRDFKKGGFVAIWPCLKRIDREISGCLHKTYRLESDVWVHVLPEQGDIVGAHYKCDLNRLRLRKENSEVGWETGCSPYNCGLAMDIPSISHYLESEAYEKFADARLFDDYAPTRDRSESPTGSVFTYKSMAYENLPTPGSRGSLDLYTAMIFGEAVELEGRNPAKLRIKCPSALKCSIKAEYAKQMKALREPIEHDKDELGGVIDGTWFGSATREEEGHIYVHFETGIQYEYNFRRDFKKGEVVAIWASLKRIDREVSGGLHKTYRIESDFWVPASPEEADIVGADYTCDLNAGECEFC